MKGRRFVTCEGIETARLNGPFRTLVWTVVSAPSGFGGIGEVEAIDPFPDPETELTEFPQRKKETVNGPTLNRSVLAKFAFPFESLSFVIVDPSGRVTTTVTPLTGPEPVIVTFSAGFGMAHELAMTRAVAIPFVGSNVLGLAPLAMICCCWAWERGKGRVETHFGMRGGTVRSADSHQRVCRNGRLLGL